MEDALILSSASYVLTNLVPVISILFDAFEQRQCLRLIPFARKRGRSTTLEIQVVYRIIFESQAK